MQRHWSSSIPVKPCGLWDAAFIGRFSAYCGFFAAIIFWSGVLMVGFLQPEYQPFADTVSKMGRVGRSFAGMINGTLIATGILLGLFALSLPSLNESLSSTRKMIAGFGFIGLAGAGLLPCDQICAGWSLPNILHTLPVAIGFTCLQFGLLQIAKMEASNRLWINVPAFALGLFHAGLLAVSFHFLGRWSVVPILDAYLGLSEKLYLAALFALVLLISKRLQGQTNRSNFV